MVANQRAEVAIDIESLRSPDGFDPCTGWDLRDGPESGFVRCQTSVVKSSPRQPHMEEAARIAERARGVHSLGPSCTRQQHQFYDSAWPL